MVLIIDMFDSGSKSKKVVNAEVVNSRTSVGGGYDEVKLTPEEKIKKKNSTTLPDKALDKLKSTRVDTKKVIDDPEADKKLLKFLAFNLK